MCRFVYIVYKRVALTCLNMPYDSRLQRLTDLILIIFLFYFGQSFSFVQKERISACYRLVSDNTCTDEMKAAPAVKPANDASDERN